MKKIGLFILAICLYFSGISQDVTGTTQTDPKFRLGLSFSPVVSWFATSGDAGLVDPDGARINIAFGLNTDFRIGDNSQYYFSTGLFLLNTGGTLTHDYFRQNEDGTFSETERTSDFRVNYVNIPVTIMLRTQEIGYSRYFARVGFDAGVSTKSTYDYEDLRLSDEQTFNFEDEDASDLTSLFRFGLRVEGGFEYNVGGTTNLFFTAAYNHGLNNVFTDDYKLPVVDS
ncbi:MAG TPA: outer membrane beta-barrel protein, partial [Cryomorphaceae bacterium]|nr:outer membrane beta-barrel protein [Cryomorphaceae bacterium]